MNNSEKPAYPVQIDNEVDVHNYGLTKREYFAAMAMQGLITMFNGSEMENKELVKRSISAADALLTELSKPIKNETN